ncbi:S-layer protein, partial [Candidatus Woesearchaeota archaeon]|nr:S-layer protein [Candidatus Woesearchaeota archaeon]
HGPFKARARDGHYAIALALFLGNYAEQGRQFSVKLDTEIDLKKHKNNLIVVGGPVTNLVMARINDFLPSRFSEKKPWGIRSSRDTYTEDEIGMIARITNPYNPEYKIIAIAGIRFSGTRSAAIALTRDWKKLLDRFTGQKEWSGIVHGYDIDGDGKVDSIEILE